MSEKILMIDSNKLDWEDPPRGYYLTEVKQKVLWEDKKTGATVALVKFPVGVPDEVHSHPEANQFVYTIDGEVEDKKGNIKPLGGIFTYVPKGKNHGGTKCTKEILLLFFWDGPPSTHKKPVLGV
jgi:quercetin dioxygenase-like cupin family protein